MVARIEAAPLSQGTAAHATAILRHLADGRGRDTPRATGRGAFPRDRRLGFADGRDRRRQRRRGARRARAGAFPPCRAGMDSCVRVTACCLCQRRPRPGCWRASPGGTTALPANASPRRVPPFSAISSGRRRPGSADACKPPAPVPARASSPASPTSCARPSLKTRQHETGRRGHSRALLRDRRHDR